jgi:predicted peptidase
MKKYYSVLLFLTFLMSPSKIFAQEYRYATYEEEGQSLPYRILLPENYSAKKNYPLLVFLHGSGERGNDNELQLVHGSSLFLGSEFRKNNPAIIIFPQCSKNAYWATTSRTDTGFSYVKKPKNNPMLDLVEGMMDHIKDNYGVDKERIYVGGLSMGGMGTFELVYRNPRMFAAAFAICGGANPKIARKIRRPVWRIDHGDADQVVAIDHSKKMVSALLKKRASVIYNWYPGVNHNSWDTVFGDPEFLPWLFAQKK